MHLRSLRQTYRRQPYMRHLYCLVIHVVNSPLTLLSIPLLILYTIFLGKKQQRVWINKNLPHKILLFERGSNLAGHPTTPSFLSTGGAIHIQRPLHIFDASLGQDPTN